MENNDIVVVIGAGRSGTSLTMQLLEVFGMGVSESMVMGKEQNPYGAYEDKEIFNLQERLQAKIIPNGMPPLSGWMDEQITKDTINKMVDILLHKLKSTSNVWGFKDPRTALFIPMWTIIFNKIGLTPKYILSVRNPSSVVVSMKRQYNFNESVSELFWLTKYTEALQNTGANCFILHYEDLLLENNESIIKELLAFTNLTPNTEHIQIKSIVGSIIKLNLNRAQFEDYKIKNQSVRMLYQILKKSRGVSFDRKKLMSDVIKCKKEMKGFLGWAIEASRIYDLRNTDNNRCIQQYNEYKKELELIKNKNKQLVLKSNDYKEKMELITADNEQLLLQMNGHIKETELITESNKKIALESYDYKEKKQLETADNEKLLLQMNGHVKEVELIKEDNKKLVFESNECIKEFKVINDENESLELELNKYINKAEATNCDNEALRLKVNKYKVEIEAVRGENESLALQLHDCIIMLDSVRSKNKDLELDLNETIIELEKIKERNKQITLQSSEYLKELKDKFDEIENINIHLNYSHDMVNQIDKLKNDIKKMTSTLNRKNSNVIPRLEKENFELKTSSSFRIGQVFVNAIAKPGVNTVLLPYNFFKVIIEAAFIKKCVK